MTELVRVEANTLAEKKEWTALMATSTLLPRQYQQNPGNLFFAVEYADALGVDRIHALTSIHVIDGKPTASADLIGSLIRKAGHKLRITGDDTYAQADLIRADDPDFTFTARWDLAKARAAGLLNKSVWKSFPAAMLRSRAITEVARMGAPDALYGVIYTPEELGAEDGGERSPAQMAPAPPAAPRTAAERMSAALPQSSAPAVDSSSAAEDPGQGREPVVPAGPAPSAGAEPEEDAKAPTQAQMRKMGALMREANLTDRTSALAYVEDVIGRKVASRNEMTRGEVARVIDDLEVPKPLPQGDGDPWATQAEEPVDAEIVPDDPTAELWERILIAAAAEGMTAADAEDDFARENGGLTAADATAEQMQAYLDLLTHKND